MRLSLRDCYLSGEWTNGKRLDAKVDLPSGCLFMKDRSGRAQVVQTKQGATALVVSSHLVGPSGDCDTRIRAVVVARGSLGVSTEEQRIASCGAEGPFDTLMFHVLARSAKPGARNP